MRASPFCTGEINKHWIFFFKVSEYDQEIPQSHTADQPRAPLHSTFTVTRHPKDNKSIYQPALFLVKMIAKLEWT